MVDVDMGPMPPKVIGKVVCLQTRGPSKPSKDPRPKRCPNIWRKEELKEIKDSVKVEMEVCIIKDMMGVVGKNELKFQRLTEHHPF